MSKRIEHLDISFPLRGWHGENVYEGSSALEESVSAWVMTERPYPFVTVGVGDKWADDWSAMVMSVEEATRLKDALVEALARISRMKSPKTAA